MSLSDKRKNVQTYDNFKWEYFRAYPEEDVKKFIKGLIDDCSFYGRKNETFSDYIERISEVLE